MNEIRVGTGFDVHRFKKGKFLKLFGIKIPFDKSLEGHSDADVGFHSIVDAVLGGLCLGDIGNHFPPTERKWKNKASFFYEICKRFVNSKKNLKLITLILHLFAKNRGLSVYKSSFLKVFQKLLMLKLKG